MKTKIDSSNHVPFTILQQIKGGRDSQGNSGQMMMMCWAFQNPWGESKITDAGYGFLEFTVDGARFKGEVRVTLTLSDTYTITFIDNLNTQEVIVDTITDVYFPELPETIDRYVESGE